MRPYVYWNPLDHNLDAPMLIPALIPPGYVQDWHSKEERYVLVRQTWGDLPGVFRPKITNGDARGIIPKYKPKPKIAMSEDNIVEVPLDTTETPIEAPEAIQEPQEAVVEESPSPETNEEPKAE